MHTGTPEQETRASQGLEQRPVWDTVSKGLGLVLLACDSCWFLARQQGLGLSLGIILM
jgi:hypothetical protein